MPGEMSKKERAQQAMAETARPSGRNDVKRSDDAPLPLFVKRATDRTTIGLGSDGVLARAGHGEGTKTNKRGLYQSFISYCLNFLNPMASALVSRLLRASPARCHGLIVRRSSLSPSSASSTQAKTNAFGSTLPEVIDSVGWDGAWQRKVTPWDTGAASTLLESLLTSGRLPPGPALVPGVGSGHDAFALARSGRRTTAIDISATAVERCVASIEADPALRRLAADGSLSVKAADFFAFAGPQRFGLVWDYTLLCALPPAAWPKWAATMRKLVEPSNGSVVFFVNGSTTKNVD